MCSVVTQRELVSVRAVDRFSDLISPLNDRRHKLATREGLVMCVGGCVRVYARERVCVCVCVCACVRACVCVCMCICLYVIASVPHNVYKRIIYVLARLPYYVYVGHYCLS